MGRYRELDGWRGLLALSIIFVHYGLAIQIAHFRSGALAVEVFFLLSGFVLTHRYDAAIGAGARTGADFVVARIRRLLPTHLVVLAAIILFATARTLLGQPSHWTGDQALALTPWALVRLLWEGSLLNAIIPMPSDHWGINGVDWSISIELWVSPILLFWFGRRGAGRFAAAALLALAVVAYLVWTKHYFHSIRATRFWIIYEWPLRGVVGFLLGYLCYHVARAFDGERLPRWLATLAELAIAVWVFAIFRSKPGGFVDLQILAAGCLLLVVYSYGRGLVSAALRTPPFQWLGAISFSLYLIHRPIEFVLESLGLGEPPLQLYLPLVLVAATILEWAVKRLMGESPPRKRPLPVPG